MNHTDLKNTTYTKTCINHNKKILLADDCIDRLQENKQLLQQAGYCVDFANNGEQALAKLAAGECEEVRMEKKRLCQKNLKEEKRSLLYFSVSEVPSE